jgi:hypothetical protein
MCLSPEIASRQLENKLSRKSNSETLKHLVTNKLYKNRPENSRTFHVYNQRSKSFQGQNLKEQSAPAAWIGGNRRCFSEHWIRV